MFFLLPIIAGITTAMSSATGVALGVTASVGIGATIKGAIDYTDAKDRYESSKEDFALQYEKTKKAVIFTQKKLLLFEKLKIKTQNTVIQNAIKHLSKKRFIRQSFKSRIKALEKEFLSALKAQGNNRRETLFLHKDNAHDNYYPTADGGAIFGTLLLKGPLTLMRKGSRELTKASMYASLMDQDSEYLKTDKKTCRIIQKRITEGRKIISTLCEKIATLVQTRPRDIESLLNFSETLFRITQTHICSIEGKLIDESEYLFRSTIKELAIE
ncbi:MAG: hypothetical protein ACRC4W_06485 [Treponemataceae bacterium]